MKRTTAVLLALLTVWGSTGKVWAEMPEWGLPKDMATDQDYQRVVKQRKTLIVTGFAAFLTGTAIILAGESYRRKGTDMNIYTGQVLTDPMTGQGYRETIPGAMEQRSKYVSRGGDLKKIGAGVVMVSAVLLTVGFSLRF